MMWRYLVLQVCISLIIVKNCVSISSPIQPLMSYQYSMDLQANVADLHWTINDEKQEIIFELHVKSTGWIALGISPGKIFIFIFISSIILYLAGGMKDADIAVGWVDSQGKVYIQVRNILFKLYAYLLI